MVQSHTLSNFSEKQQAYAGYLLEKLGYEEGSDTDHYLEVLSKKAYQYKAAGNTKKVPLDNQCFYYQIGDVWQKKRFTVIDFLHEEVQIKKNKKYKLKDNTQGYITASDLSNYVFCPVGYSIARTLNGVTTTVAAKEGTKLHELSILKKDSGSSGYTRQQTGTLKDDSNAVFFDDINSSEILYAGHTDEETNYFINEERKFVGDPDYVFINKESQNYIVEEKFIDYKKRTNDYFYPNHKIQLASYVKYLINFKAQYGYLVYWLYDNDYGNKSIIGCQVHKIEMNYSINNWLESKMDAVVSFRESGVKTIKTSSLKASKCGGCAHSLYCGHKNKRKDNVSFPYDTSDHNLYPAEYPVILNIN